MKSKLEQLADELAPMKERILGILKEEGYGRLLFTMSPHEEDLRLLKEYAIPIKAYRALWLDVIYPSDDDWDETDFNGFTEGFFMALGVNRDDAYRLNTFLRYNLQYFEPEYQELSRGVDNQQQ